MAGLTFKFPAVGDDAALSAKIRNVNHALQ